MLECKDVLNAPAKLAICIKSFPFAKNPQCRKAELSQLFMQVCSSLIITVLEKGSLHEKRPFPLILKNSQHRLFTQFLDSGNPNAFTQIICSDDAELCEHKHSGVRHHIQQEGTSQRISCIFERCFCQILPEIMFNAVIGFPPVWSLLLFSNFLVLLEGCYLFQCGQAFERDFFQRKLKFRGKIIIICDAYSSCRYFSD